MSSDTPLSNEVKTSEAEGTPETSAAEQAPAVTTNETTSTEAPQADVSAEPTKPAVAEDVTPADTPAESTPIEPAPAPTETPAEATAAPTTPAPANQEETAAPETTAAAPQESAPATPPRARLNPTVNTEMAKAVPSVNPAAATPAVEAGAPATEETQSQGQTEEQVEASAPAAAPVELPGRDIDLDAALEAEIDAAVKADESVATAAVETQQAAAETEATEGTDPETLEPGAKLKAKVQSLHGDNVFFDLPGRSPGVVSARQFLTDKPPSIGDEFDVVVERVDEADGLIVLNLPRGKRSVGGNWDAVAKGQVVDCMVTKTNKGGLEVTVSSLRGFMPASQIDLSYVGDMEVYVGQKLTAVVTEANPKKRNLVVSRRAFLDIARKEAAEELWKTLAEGQTFTGQVKTIKNYGAFIDIGGVDGFLHIGEISWTRLNHPSDVLSEGQEVEVQVIKLEREKKRISLGMKQLKADPWTLAAANYPVGNVVSGRVTRTMDFGAFVELEPGIEGLVHISELDYSRVNKVTDVLNIDQHIELKVLEVDPSRRRIGLSLKQLKEKPPEMKAAAAEPDEPVEPLPERKRKGPLKGGTGPDTKGGGLFGNPNDFK